MLKKGIYFSFLFLLLACSGSVIIAENKSRDVQLTDDYAPNKLDSLIRPYSDSVKSQMGEIIAFAENDFSVKRKPSGNLSNWVADAVFSNQTKHVRLKEPAFCLLNTGGIRSSINHGDVSIGDIFKVMPFDNEIVWVRMNRVHAKEIAAYIIQKGGDPVSNAILSESELKINGQIYTHEYFWVITSDYLMEGGDNMEFFKNKTEVVRTGKLIRTALIEEARFQKVLINDTSNRMLF